MACSIDLTTQTARRSLPCGEVFGIKLIGVRAAARRRAIFELAGMDSAQQATWKSLSVSQREARRVAREVARAREAAQMSKVRTEDGAVLTGAEWVDRSIADGSSEIITFRQVRACGTRSRIPRVLCRFRCVRMTERSPITSGSGAAHKLTVRVFRQTRLHAGFFP